MLPPNRDKLAKPSQRDPALPADGKPRERTHASDPIPAKIRAAVKARSGGLCEDECGRPAVHVHHRKLRSQGGKHETPNLLHLSTECHDFYHHNRKFADLMGYIVSAADDPAARPVMRKSGEGWQPS